jgi:hypothetical protein
MNFEQWKAAFITELQRFMTPADARQTVADDDGYIVACFEAGETPADVAKQFDMPESER